MNKQQIEAEIEELVRLAQERAIRDFLKEVLAAIEGDTADATKLDEVRKLVHKAK